LLEQGIYTPIELLSLAGSLRHAHLEAWRLGQVDTLDGGIDEPLTAVRRLLTEAQAYAHTRGLVVEPYAPIGVESQTPGRDKLSSDSEVDALLSVRFVPSKSEPQLDLFTNSAVSVLIGDLIDAILARRFDEADTLLKESAARGVDPARQQGFHRLRDAQRHFDSGLQDPDAASDLLQRTIEPLASKHLGARFREFLVPLWHALAEAMEGRPFDPAHPCLHSSHAFARALAWDRALQSVEQEPAWRQQPELRLRAAVALHRLGNRRTARAAWFDVFWHFPEQAQAAMDGTELPDPVLRRHWRAFCDLVPPLEPEDFPAWCMLAAYSPDPAYETSEVASTAAETFRLVCALIRARSRAGATPDAETIALRARLQAAHPVLFLHHMHRQASAEPR
ncbi:MAG: hypothetical protein ACR2RB_06070, partial [Gammaproteobacteria bacterium]